MVYKCSKLANPIELPLNGVGVDFVLPYHNKNNHPPLASTRRNGPTCLRFGGIPGCLRVSGSCLKCV